MKCGGESQDVNQSANAGAAGSSSAEGGSTGSSAGAVDSSSADSLNTDTESTTPEIIPYARFKEVNEAKRALEEKIAKFSPYEQMDQILQQDPELFAEVEKTFKGYVERKSQRPQQDQTVQHHSNDDVASLKNEVREMKFEKIRDNYRSSWNDLTKEIDSEEEKAALMKLTELEMYARHKAPYAEYNDNLLKDSFKAAKELVDKMISKKSAGYVKDKVDDDVPGTGSGAGAVGKKSVPRTREERAAFIAQGLKAGHKG